MVVVMKWLPIVRAESEDTHVFVKTDRGIEPARKQNNFLDNAVEGDLALCKSVQGYLIMMDYTKKEVEA